MPHTNRNIQEDMQSKLSGYEFVTDSTSYINDFLIKSRKTTDLLDKVGRIDDKLRSMEKRILYLEDTTNALIIHNGESESQLEKKDILYVILTKKNENMNKLHSISKLKENWNENGADPFSDKVIDNAYSFINAENLKYQPDLFPTGRDSIQAEYELENGDYLEVEIYDDHFDLYIKKGVVEEERGKVTLNEIIRMVNGFYPEF